jgi:hypothetical protein
MGSATSPGLATAQRDGGRPRYDAFHANHEPLYEMLDSGARRS